MWRLVMTLLTVTLLAIAAASGAQSSGTQSSGTVETPKERPKKPKKVWTTEDLSKIRGGVSVVGEKEAEKPAETSADDGEAQEPAAAEPAIESKKTEPCVTRSWAAAVDAILAAQGVGLGRGYWMDKFFGGDLCPPSLPAIAGLAKRMDGDHFLDDGTKVKLQSVTSSGTFSTSDMVALHDRGVSFLLVWKGHPYLTTRLGGIVYVSEEGGRNYEIQEIELYDPYEDRPAKFSVKKGHKASEIDGMVEIRITR